MNKVIRTTMRVKNVRLQPYHLPLYLSPDDGYEAEPSVREEQLLNLLGDVYARILNNNPIEFSDGGDSGRDNYYCALCDGASPETRRNKGKVVYWAKPEDIQHKSDCLYVEALRWQSGHAPLKDDLDGAE